MFGLEPLYVHHLSFHVLYSFPCTHSLQHLAQAPQGVRTISHA